MNVFETDEDSEGDMEEQQDVIPEIDKSLEQPVPDSRYYNDFIQMAEIGSGEFGSVFKCLNRLDGCVYAIKKTRRPLKGSVTEKRALNEVYAHAVLGKHSRVVRYYSAWAEDNHMFIQNEFCEGGSLATLLNDMKSRNETFTEVQLKKILRDIALGLKYIHSQNLVHMDIKPENIFISKNVDPTTVKSLNKTQESSDDGFQEDSDAEAFSEVTYKIGDLGLVTSVVDGQAEEGDCRYLPLEILRDDYLSLPKADIFALGLTIYEAVSLLVEDLNLVSNYLQSYRRLYKHYQKMVTNGTRYAMVNCLLLKVTGPNLTS